MSPLASPTPDALLRQLGPAEVRGRNAVAVLAPTYATLAEDAERRALGA